MTDPGTRSLPEGLGVLIKETQAVLHQRMDEELRPLALSVPQYACLQALHDAGLQCRPVWQPLHMLPMYREHPRADLSRTESLARRLISLPSSAKLGLPFIGG